MSEPRSLEEWIQSCNSSRHIRPQHDGHCPFPQVPCDCGGDRLIPSLCRNCARAYARQQVEAMRKRAATLARLFERSEMASHSEVCGCPEVKHAAMWEVQDRLATAIWALPVEEP